MALHCSWDGGVTWPSTLQVNPGTPAAYSVMAPAPGDSVVVLWEQRPNQVSHVFTLDWCTTPDSA